MTTDTKEDIVRTIPETIPKEGLSWGDFFLYLGRNDFKPESPLPATETLSSDC